MAFSPWWRSAKLSAEPSIRASNTRVAERPARRASVIASASATTFWNSTMLLMSLVACPAPGPPQCVMSVAMWASSGRMRLYTGSVPPTMIESVPFFAASRVRATGASAKYTPRAEKRDCRSRVSATVTVLRSMM
jgi:hypothetical protein